MKKKSNFLKLLGPGVLFASTAIGVSHLVQSTMAGALYGFGLVWAIIAANLFKYPFFEFGSRYANSKGESIIAGYRRLGKNMLLAYLGITFISMFLVASAVGAVTAGFLENLLNMPALLGENSRTVVTSVLFLSCMFILLYGKFSALDKLIKVIGALLLISTLVAVIAALLRGPLHPIETGYSQILPWANGGFAFLIALMGWMPTAVDLSAWNSLWTLEKIEQSGYKPSLKETIFEFNLGYFASAILAIAFVLLGVYMLYGSNTELPASAAAFANLVVAMYTAYIGNWSYLIIAIAAFSIMFGTCIAVFDGYSRALNATLQVLNHRAEVESASHNYSKILVALVLISLMIVLQFGANMKVLVHLATTISFVVAPVIAYANLRLVTQHLEKEARPGKMLQILAWIGFFFLCIFSVVYLLNTAGLV